jgi:hypothetical protein
MGRRCFTCAHPRRAEIEHDLLNNASYRTLSGKYGISPDALRRHFEGGHIAQSVVRDAEIRKLAYSEDLLSKAAWLQDQALQILDEARAGAEPDLKTALLAIGKAANLLETQARLMGQLREVEINFFVNPVFVELRQQIVSVLAPFPEAWNLVEPILAEDKTKAEYSDVSPAVLEIINARFETQAEEPEEDRGALGVVNEEPRSAKPTPAGLQATRRRS